MGQEDLSAESAFHEGHESRFSARRNFNSISWAIAQVARRIRLWRTGMNQRFALTRTERQVLDRSDPDPTIGSLRMGRFLQSSSIEAMQ